MTDRSGPDSFAAFMAERLDLRPTEQQSKATSEPETTAPRGPAPDRSQGARTSGPGKQDPARAFTEHLKNQLWRQGRRSGF